MPRLIGVSISRFAHGFALVLVATLLAACATGQRGPRVGSSAVTVEVRNDLVPARSITVRMSSTRAGRKIIGSVSPGQTARLRYKTSTFTGHFQLVAEGDRGKTTIESEPFNLEQDDRLVWSLRNNVIRFLEPEY